MAFQAWERYWWWSSIIQAEWPRLKTFTCNVKSVVIGVKKFIPGSGGAIFNFSLIVKVGSMDAIYCRLLCLWLSANCKLQEWMIFPFFLRLCFHCVENLMKVVIARLVLRLRLSRTLFFQMADKFQCFNVVWYCHVLGLSVFSWRIVRVNSFGCGNYFSRKSINVLMMVVLGLHYFSGHCWNLCLFSGITRSVVSEPHFVNT